MQACWVLMGSRGSRRLGWGGTCEVAGSRPRESQAIQSACVTYPLSGGPRISRGIERNAWGSSRDRQSLHLPSFARQETKNPRLSSGVFLAPAVRFELTTKRLTAARSTTELRRIMWSRSSLQGDCICHSPWTVSIVSKKKSLKFSGTNPSLRLVERRLWLAPGKGIQKLHSVTMRYKP